MTHDEFNKEMKRLVEAFPQSFSSKTRNTLIFEKIKDFEIGWFRQKVEMIILNNDPRFKFEEAARNERIHRKSVQFTNDLVRASEKLKEQMTDEGFKKVLESFQAKSIWEAIEKQRKA